MSKNKGIMHSDWAESLSTLAPEALVREVRRQSKPRRWPWQPKTLRDLVNERQSHMSDLAAERSAELAELLADRRDRVKDRIRHQSKPRRFPWQPKTARDHIDVRIGKMTELAAERSAELAALAATRRDNILGRIEAESRPRRFPWQQKTTRDRFDERVETLAHRAATRRDELAEQVTSARDELLSQFEHEARGRRFPWQQKTTRDKAEERLGDLASQAASRRDELAEHVHSARGKAEEQLDALGSEAASRRDELASQVESARADLLGRLESETSHRRFPWQRKTARDKVEERLDEFTSGAVSRRDELTNQIQSLRDELDYQGQGRRFPWQQKTAHDKIEEQMSTLSNQRDELMSQIESARDELASQLESETSHRRFPWQKKVARDKAEERMSDMSAAFSDGSSSVQDALKAAPLALGAVALGAVEAVRDGADSTGSSIREGADKFGRRVSTTSEQAAANVRAVAKAPVKAINRKVESGKRTMRWSARVVKAGFWALLIGAAIGVLYSPRSGRELRAEIRNTIIDFLNKILPA